MVINDNWHFAVYNLCLDINHSSITRKLIVMKDDNNFIVKWTNLHRFITPHSGIQEIQKNGNSKFDCVVIFLNYIFFYKKRKSVIDTKFEDVVDFINAYSLGDTDFLGARKNKTATVKKCLNSVLDFLKEVYMEYPELCKYNPDRFFRNKKIIDKRGKITMKKELSFKTNTDENDKRILRDIPDGVFWVLFHHIRINHRDIFMPFVLSAFAGLRPSEALNVRREDSPLGAGLILEQINGRIISIDIDLRKELTLRSDLKSVGRIKKERLQRMNPIFYNIFLECYNEHLENIANRNYEKEYGPLTIDSQGKAMMYATYRYNFKKAVQEIIPKLLSSDDQDLVVYGQLLEKYPLSPHALRHWFTVYLTKANAVSSEVMSARGDTSEESAKVYLHAKSELAKMTEHINDVMYEYGKWINENRT